MNETQTVKKHTKFRDNVTAMSIVGVIALILLASVLAVGCAIWDDYRDEIMDSQKNQLLITSQTIAGNMELSLKEYVENLNYLHQQYLRGEDSSFFRRYIDGKDSPEINLYIEDPQGDVTESLYDFELLESLQVTRVSDNVTVWQAKMQSQSPRDRHILIFKHTLANGGRFCLVIDEDPYYQQLTSGVQIGTNGYVMVKNSGGIILMHPEENQVGIHVIEGRKALYPDLDYTSLEAMIDEQCSGGDGLSEYYSYWWTSSPLVMVKKISAYAESDIGGDFWVVSSVIDYDDFFEPIEAGFRKVSSLFAVSLAAAAVLFICVSSLLLDRRRALTEIRSLKELNERLETIHRGEELMAHQQRLQVIGTMTGGIAHEFNNLLTPIMGYADLLLMELDEDSDAYENALEICDASEKAKDVVRQISLMSRRNVETVFTGVDCGQMLDRAWKMVQPICPANIRMELENGLEGVSILGNRSQLHQVILNICINAIHAIGDGEGRVAISGGVIPRDTLAEMLAGRGIKVSENWGSYAAIHIRDNGCGMDPETLRQVFKPFFTTKKAGEGTGLGLALAEQIVTSHRGILCAESAPGEGSTFHICLPVLTTSELLTEMAPGEAQKLRIAAGDDNPKVLGLLEKNFRKLDVPIRTGSTRAELLAILRDGETDALVIDEHIEERERSGVDFCMSLQGQFPSLLKLVMADYITDELVEAMQNHIIDGCLLKPVSDASILEEIRRLQTARP